MSRWLQLLITVFSALISNLMGVRAATIPINPTLGGTSCSTNSPANQEIASNSTPVGFTPWPCLPPFGYQILDFPPAAMTYTQIVIKAGKRFSRTEEILEFVQDFQKELKEHYGQGGDLLPRKVGMKRPDPQEVRKWHIYFETRRFKTPRLTAEMAWTILQYVRYDFKNHGASAIEVWIGEKVFEYGFAHLTFEFTNLGAVQEPGCSENGTFYTCPADDDTNASLQVTR